jgi:N-acyl homoserine lactone hydrolase
MYTLHSLVDGFPGKSSSHGAFGWSSLWLLQDGDRRVLIDAGPPAYIPLIHEGLAEHGLTTADITDVLVTHLHWDHVGNFTMYPHATTWVGEEELAWAATQPAGTKFIPDLHVQELLRRTEGVERMHDAQEVLPGITAIASPGHTPGHLAFHVETAERSHVFAGDAVKNVFELNTLQVDSTMDADASHASVDRLRSLLRDTDGLLVPGHDVALGLDGNDAVRLIPQSAQVGFFVDGVHGEADRSIR